MSNSNEDNKENEARQNQVKEYLETKLNTEPKGR